MAAPTPSRGGTLFMPLGWLSDAYERPHRSELTAVRIRVRRGYR